MGRNTHISHINPTYFLHLSHKFPIQQIFNLFYSISPLASHTFSTNQDLSFNLPMWKSTSYLQAHFFQQNIFSIPQVCQLPSGKFVDKFHFAIVPAGLGSAKDLRLKIQPLFHNCSHSDFVPFEFTFTLSFPSENRMFLHSFSVAA